MNEKTPKIWRIWSIFSSSPSALNRMTLFLDMVSELRSSISVADVTCLSVREMISVTGNKDGIPTPQKKPLRCMPSAIMFWKRVEFYFVTCVS